MFERIGAAAHSSAGAFGGTPTRFYRSVWTGSFTEPALRRDGRRRGGRLR